MTSTPVTELHTMYTNVTKSNAINSQIGTFGSNFSEVMSKAGNSANSSQDVMQSGEKKVSEEPQDAYAKQISKENGTEAEKAVGTTENVQDTQSVQEENVVEDASVKEKVLGAADKIVKAIAEELQVSEEEILKAMEALGMTMFDLLNPDNMAGLVLQISGETDMIHLLTNEDLYNSVQTLMETVNVETASLQEALGMNDEQFATIMNELDKAAIDEQLVQTDTLETSENAPVIEITRETEDAQAENMQKNLTGQNDVSEENVNADNSTQTLKTTETANVKEQHMTDGQESKGDNHNQSQMTYAQQTTGTNIMQHTVFAEQHAASFVSEETNQIMHQIMDYMKINVTADVSELEMQLHPESLGNVKIQLATKDGIVTAQFKAESELVKAAIESQMVQLKESLNEKGVKVEAIEVTVESHAFERNLEQGNEGNNNPKEPQKKSTRRINLNMLHDVDELLVDEMEDADKIATEMMVQAGNTVDFTA